MKRKIILLFMLSLFLYGNEIPIIFQGNKQINDRNLYEALNIYEPYFYEFWKKQPVIDFKTVALAVETIKNYYRTRGFYHAIVASPKVNKKIIIKIQEGKPILIDTISTISKLQIWSFIPFKKGDIFDTQKFEQSKKNIKLFYENHGYCNAKLDAKAWIDIITNTAYLTYEVNKNKLCYLKSITIHPPKNIDSKIIKSLLYIKKGELYSTERIRQSYKNLYGHGGISSAIINTNIKNNDEVNVSVSVVETKKPIRFQTGVGINSNEGLTLTLGIKNRNLFGNLKTLGLDTKYTQIKQSININFDMPLVNKKSTGFKIGYANENFLGFNEKGFTGTIFLKQREELAAFQESLIFDNSNIYDSDNQVLYPEGNFFFLSPAFNWAYDTRDNIFNPTRGYFLSAAIKGSIKSVVSNATYYKYNLTGAYIFPILPSLIALRANYGSLHLYDGNLPSSYHFFAGGMDSNRAYGYRKLGPTDAQGNPLGLNSVLELTAEYRFPIYGDFRGVVFNDNTFIGTDDIPNLNQGFYSAGFGLRYITPIGPIAIDFGFDIGNPTKQYALHFRIGESF